MLLSLEQYDILRGAKNVSGRSVGPIPIPFYAALWDAPVNKHLWGHHWGKCYGNSKCVGVPYKLYPKGDQRAFTTQQLQKIQFAIDEIELNTCIR
jgi:hypothetical protein